jgi:hypothetical protein
VAADHGRLKARLRPMRGLKRRRSARIVVAGHALVQNICRGHYEIATDVRARHRLRVAFDQLTTAIWTLAASSPRPVMRADRPTQHRRQQRMSI